ncbi:hypothetical protein C0992_000586 [Termitomyces sp. T32_za158]|nr:hypothetical protein C0992_000586 [Termitomyces sp. T32_za158]
MLSVIKWWNNRLLRQSTLSSGLGHPVEDWRETDAWEVTYDRYPTCRHRKRFDPQRRRWAGNTDVRSAMRRLRGPSMSHGTCGPVSDWRSTCHTDSSPRCPTDTGDRPYRCQFCPDQFARRSAVFCLPANSHKFFSSDLLSRHVNKCHEAEKPPAGPPGRKGSRTALRATSSKQACDQCVKSALSCDGAKPCGMSRSSPV